MIVYRTAPAKERKAAAELRRAHIRAYLPQEDGQTSNRRRFRRVVAPGYIFTEGTPKAHRVVKVTGSSKDGFTIKEQFVESKYVRELVGTIKREALASLYSQRRSVKPAPPRPFKSGDAVTIKLGTGPISGTIIKVQSERRVLVDAGAKTLTVSMKRLEFRG